MTEFGVGVDTMARCILLWGAGRPRRATVAEIARSQWNCIPDGWPVVRLGPEHERRHRALKRAGLLAGMHDPEVEQISHKGETTS